MPLIETKGAASAQGFGEFSRAGAEPVYIESCFSTFLYTGNGSTQTITNGIDVTGKGGLIWFKERASQGFDHALVDTARGNLSATEGYSLASNQTSAQSSVRAVPTSSGFSLSSGSGAGPVNFNGSTYASWTFRKQPKFFDVVTYTGTGSATTIAHSLGSVPGCIIVKRTDAAADWAVYHRSTGATNVLFLNGTNAAVTSSAYWNDTDPTSTAFTVGTNFRVNTNGATYVAYLFAHDAGGFGLTGADNVISCGSYTGTNAAGNAQNLGYEPQWLLIKSSSGTGSWFLFDNMRGIPTGGNDAALLADSSIAEFANANRVDLTSTGFQFGGADLNNSETTYIYIAIRRGPMKTPTTGTSVFSPQAVTKSGNTTVTAGFPVDLSLEASRSGSTGNLNSSSIDRLRGGDRVLITSSTAAEYSGGGCSFASNTTFTDGWLNNNPNIYWMFQRAPGFFDVVCYTGTGAGQTVNHNLGVIPELIILKNRTSVTAWPVKCPVGLTDTGVVYLDSDTFNATGVWQSGDTSTTFKTRAISNLYYNQSGQNYVAYLFASAPGVSKVGSYTGTGSTLQINCGFTGGARFVLIKRTDNTGDWYVWDTARGIVSGNDPYLLLNSTAAEVTNTDYIDTYSAGFEISSTAPAAINANGGSFIYLAIA